MRVNKNNQFINCQQNTVASGDWRLRTEIIHYAEQSRILRQSQWLCNNHFNHHSHQADQHDAHRFPRSAAIRSSFFLFVREQNKKKNCYTNKKCIWNLIARLESNQRPTIMAPCPSDTFPREEIIDSNDALRVFEVCRSTAELRATKNDMRIAQFKNRSLGLRRAVTRVFFFIPTDDSSGTCGSDFLSF